MKLSKLTLIFVTALFITSFCFYKVYSGFGFGMTGGVKNKVEELDEKVAEEKKKTEPEVKYTYSGSASAGDLVVFTVDQTNQTYETENITTGQTDTGSYSVLSGNLTGVKEVNVGSDYFFAVELDDKIIAANFPTGNNDNELSYGVSSAIDNTGKVDQIEGNYVFIIISSGTVNDSSDIKEWGTLSVFSSTWTKKSYATDYNNPATDTYQAVSPSTGSSYVDLFPITSPQEKGDWTVNGTKQERLDVTITSPTVRNFTGFAYASSNASAFILDLGQGEGFLLGIKVNNTVSIGQSDIAGTYKFVDVTAGGTRGAGNYTIPSSGDGTYTHKEQGGTTESGDILNIGFCPQINNMFFGQLKRSNAGSPEDVVYAITIGDIIMHFTFDISDGHFVSYGAGAKL
ncbi:MAG: hypothetical protein ACOC5R_01515 [Elusimicrobiota bacterium]